jgi:hypothetical protein
MTVGSVLAETGAQGRDLPLPAWAIGLTAFALLVMLLLLAMSFGKDR